MGSLWINFYRCCRYCYVIKQANEIIDIERFIKVLEEKLKI